MYQETVNKLVMHPIRVQYANVANYTGLSPFTSFPPIVCEKSRTAQVLNLSKPRKNHGSDASQRILDRSSDFGNSEKCQE